MLHNIQIWDFVFLFLFFGWLGGVEQCIYKTQVDIVLVQQVTSLKVTKGVEKQNDGWMKEKTLS